jgi:hypothetical protein
MKYSKDYCRKFKKLKAKIYKTKGYNPWSFYAGSCGQLPLHIEKNEAASVYEAASYLTIFYYSAFIM